MSIAIRPLKSSDRAGWEKLWLAYLAFYEVDLDGEITELTWQRALDPLGPVQAFVAEDETGAVLGITHYLFQPVTWHVNERCYLEDLYVAQEARGKGIARALIMAVKNAAVERGSDQVYWLTNHDNDTARALYDKVASNTGLIKYSMAL